MILEIIIIKKIILISMSAYSSFLPKLPEHVGTKEQNSLEEKHKTNPLVVPATIDVVCLLCLVMFLLMFCDSAEVIVNGTHTRVGLLMFDK